MGFLGSALRRNFLAGILVIIPFGLTFIILFKLGKWIAGVLGAVPATFVKHLELPPYLADVTAIAIGLVSTILVVLIVGAVTRNFIGKKLLGLGESIIARIPFARTIYSATKQIVGTVFLESGFRGLKRVVMLEYPRRGLYSLAFVTGVVDDGKSLAQQKKLVRVFVPTSPNPTSGFFLMVPEEDLTEVAMSTEEAFKIIMSLGLASEEGKDSFLSKEHDSKA